MGGMRDRGVGGAKGLASAPEEWREKSVRRGAFHTTGLSVGREKARGWSPVFSSVPRLGS